MTDEIFILTLSNKQDWAVGKEGFFFSKNLNIFFDKLSNYSKLLVLKSLFCRDLSTYFYWTNFKAGKLQGPENNVHT